MNRSILSLLLKGVLIVSILAEGQVVRAQEITFPAEMNKSFSPISIMPGEISRLSVTIYNPNAFPLTDASWIDNLVSIQPGLYLADPPNLDNPCGGTVQVAAGATSFSLSGGTVPAQTGRTPGSCTVSVDVTSTTPGNLINTIPAGALNSIGDGGTVTNTTPASATLHIETVQPPTIGKSFSPTTIPVGQISRLTIRIRNNDLVNALTQVSITDSLPANLTLARPASSALDNCGTSATLTAPSGGTTLTMNNSSIAANTICAISVNVTSTIAGIYTNTIPTNALVTAQGLTNRSPASAVLYVQAVTARKAFTPSSFQAGETTTLTITLANPTSTEYTGAGISDTLPGNVLTIVSSSAATTCGGTVTISPPRTVRLANGTIPAGTTTNPGMCTITVQVTAPANATTETFTNTIPAGTLTTDQNVTNILPVTANVRVVELQTNVTSSKSFTPDTILPGENSRMRINITAPADTSLTNLSITDHLPANVTVSNSSPAAASPNCGGSAVLTAVTGATSVTLTNGAIPAGVNCQINVYVTSSTAGVHTNALQPTDITNSEDRTLTKAITANLNVQAVTNFSMSKAFTPPLVGPGGISTLTITLTNTNSLPLENASLTDNLPGIVTSGVIVAPTPNASTNCAGGAVNAVAGSQTISMTGGTIPAQVQSVPGTCTITIDVQGMGPVTRHTDTIPITNASATLQGTNTVMNPSDPASAVLVITNLTIGIVKAFKPLTVFGGSASTLSIELVNSNNIPLTGIAFTDQMPSGMLIASPPNLSAGTCGGTLTGAPGADSFSLSGASLTAASSCTLSLSITMTVNGNLTNTIDTGAVTTFNGAVNPDPAEASLTNLPGASISKFFSPNPISSGDLSRLSITIQNTGGIALSGMGFTDSLPGGLAIVDSPAPSNQCGGTLTADTGTRTIILTQGTLAASASCTIEVSVTAGRAASYTNTIPIGALANDQNATNHEPATDTLVVTNRVTTGRGGNTSGGTTRGNTNNDRGSNQISQAGTGLLIPITGFAPNISTPLDILSHPLYYAMGLRIEIPVIGVDTSIVGVDEKDGGWDVAWLQGQIGWLEGTAYPTFNGNSLLTGHVVNADGKPGIFFHLRALHVGEYVFIYNESYRYTYQVVSNKLIQPDDASAFQHEEKSYITLLTCDKFDEKTNTYLLRVSVHARLVDVSLTK